MRLVVTGGAGFMGSNFVRMAVAKGYEVLVYDKLTYAGRLENLRGVNARVVRGDVCNEELLAHVVEEFEPDALVNFAAETHVDRSINEPAPFVRTNVLGVFTILEVARRLDLSVVHISSDEVYGDMESMEPAREDAPLNPSSPYSASKAAGDLLVRSYVRTYGVKAILVRPSNNYGPYQYPEKLIPKTIIRALRGLPVPVYGDGQQVRDWLYVEDFCEALMAVLERGSWGEVYNVPGFNERRNIDVVRAVLKIMGKPESLIRFVDDRPGHDRRYSMRGDKILALGWKPRVSWNEGLRRTVRWYVENEWWWKPLLSDEYFAKDAPWG